MSPQELAALRDFSRRQGFAADDEALAAAWARAFPSELIEPGGAARRAWCVRLLDGTLIVNARRVEAVRSALYWESL